jgi:nitroreductase
MMKPTREQWTALLNLAGTAPSLFNSQPWRIFVDGPRARVDLDAVRLAPWPTDGLCAGLALGAFEQALVLGGRALGAHVEIDTVGEGLAAVVRFDAGAPDVALGQLLTERRTSRGAVPSHAQVPDARALEAAAQTHGIELALAEQPETRAALARALGLGNAHVQHPSTLQQATARWLRVTPDDALGRRDGMDLALLAAPAAALDLLRGMVVQPDLMVRAVPLEARALMLLASFEAARGIAVFHSAATTDDAAGARGRALGRALVSVWLEATRQHLAVQPIAPALVAGCERVAWRAEHLGSDDVPIRNACAQVRDTLGLAPTREPGFALRLHDAIAPAGSLRMPVEAFTTFAS